MYSLIKIFFWSSFLVFQFACIGYKNKNSTKVVEKNYCNMLDTIVLEQFIWRTGNHYKNEIIPQLEEKSGIEANCSKGTIGYLYPEDSIFLKDVKNWRNFFKCKYITD